MKWHLTSKELPIDNSVVLIYVPYRPWECSTVVGDIHYKVAIFRKGISQKERKELPDSNKRKHIIRGCDEYGNNLKPYGFEEWGPGSFFGQEVKAWTYIEEYKENKNENKDNN